jgi:hypothetical protein
MKSTSKMRKLHTVYYFSFWRKVREQDVMAIMEKGPPSLRRISLGDTMWEVGN